MRINLIWDHTPAPPKGTAGLFITEYEKKMWEKLNANFETHLLWGQKYVVGVDPALDGPSKSVGVWSQLTSSGIRIFDPTRAFTLDFGSGDSEDPFIATAKKKCVFLTLNIN